jgi:hypothetical protein
MNIGKMMEFQYELKSKLISNYKLIKAIISFKKEVFKNVPSGHSVGLQLKVLIDEDFRSISGYSTIRTYEEFRKLITLWKFHMDLRKEAYNQYGVDALVIAYYIIPLTKKSKSKYSKHSRLLQRQINEFKDKIIKFGGYNLPNTMDLFDWVTVQFIYGEKEAVVYRYRSTGESDVKFNKHTAEVKLKVNGITTLSFTDELLNPGNLSTFRRTFKNQVYYFTEGNLLYKSITYNKSYIPLVSNSFEFNHKFITMDLETYNDNGTLVPYAISIFDGKNYAFFYLTDYKDHSDLIRASILYLMSRRYNGYRVYLHNFSKFDVVFLLKYLP